MRRPAGRPPLPPRDGSRPAGPLRPPPPRRRPRGAGERRLALPRAPPPGAGADPHPSRGQHTPLPPGRDRTVRGPRGPRPQARGREPHRLLQGPRDDGGRDPGPARGGHRRRLRLDRQHLGLDGRLRGPGRPPRPRVRPRGQGGGGQARPGPRLRRPDAPRPGRLRRVPAPRARGLRGPRDRPPQLHQPLAARGPEDDRVGDAPAAGVGPAGLDRRPRRKPRQHLRLREGPAGGPRARPHPPRPAGRLGAGQGRQPLLPQLPGRLSQALPRSGRDRRHRHPHRGPREPRPGRAHDPRDAGPRHRGL